MTTLGVKGLGLLEDERPDVLTPIAHYFTSGSSVRRHRPEAASIVLTT